VWLVEAGRERRSCGALLLDSCDDRERAFMSPLIERSRQARRRRRMSQCAENSDIE
jgi:hypothetical protein